MAEIETRVTVFGLWPIGPANGNETAMSSSASLHIFLALTNLVLEPKNYPVFHQLMQLGAYTQYPTQDTTDCEHLSLPAHVRCEFLTPDESNILPSDWYCISFPPPPLWIHLTQLVGTRESVHVLRISHSLTTSKKKPMLNPTDMQTSAVATSSLFSAITLAPDCCRLSEFIAGMPEPHIQIRFLPPSSLV